MGVRMIVATTVLLMNAAACSAQTEVPLPHEAPQPSPWTTPEREFYAKQWGSRAITNVAAPSLLVFRPESSAANGAAVIIAPGGGFYALSIEAEGTRVAKQLIQRGYTALVLKYRIVPTGADGVAELVDILQRDNEARLRYTRKFLRYSTADGLAAVRHVRQNAPAYGIDTDRIGLMGFSAGGVVLFGVVNEATDTDRPNFVVPVYPGLDLTAPRPSADAPPALFLCAADDIPPAAIIQPVAAWHAAGAPVGLHLFPRGGHGFVARQQNLPTDHWLDRFHEWAVARGLTR